MSEDAHESRAYLVTPACIKPAERLWSDDQHERLRLLMMRLAHRVWLHSSWDDDIEEASQYARGPEERMDWQRRRAIDEEPNIE